MDEIVAEYHAGFRRRRGVVNQIFVLKKLQAENYEHQAESCVIYIAFKQAHDKIIRTELYKALAYLGIQPK